ncbi:MAG: hypothetical protein HN742_32550 [Lentisphaerae bacterium]|nr:hypothetical protein [Lentisphaerota bacterium]MBT5608989.1 hypothetical protein [Lentisphaerota bacterium]MBT7054666.1 hypothetical protein [Lentisphaerota bacterium]MBT7846646.1 hypothetical protein [Lentisphaerota bacterium]
MPQPEPSQTAGSPSNGLLTEMGRETLWVSVLMMAFTVIYYWGFFDLSHDVIRRPTDPAEYYCDLIPQFGVHADVWRKSVLEHHELPHWNPYIIGGMPFLAEPGVNVFSLENLLLIFRGQVAARLSIPLHLFVGWLGLLAFFRAAGLRPRHAFLAGLLFLFNPVYAAFHGFAGHLPKIHGMAWAPWLLYVAIRPFRDRYARFLVFGILLSLMVHSGAATLFLYACIVGFPAFLGYRLLTRRATFVQAGVGGVVTVATVTGLCAMRILPGVSLLSVSGRRYGMSDAAAFVPEYITRLDVRGLNVVIRDHPVLVGPHALLLPLVLLLLAGIWQAYRTSRKGTLIALAAAIGPMLLYHSLALYTLARRTIPFFADQRHPQRGLFIPYLIGACLAGWGLVWLERRVRAPRTRVAAGWLVVTACALALMVYRPHFPTMVDDQAAQREANPILQHARQDSDFFRLSCYQDYSRYWSWEHQTVPYGLRVLVGYPRLWHEDMIYSDLSETVGVPQFPFIPGSHRNYATMTGLLAVKYVSSIEPLGEDGLELVATFPVPSPDARPPRARGPHLYRNTRSMPRASTGQKVLLLHGPEQWCRAAGFELLTTKVVDPARTAIVYAPTDAEELPDDLLAQADYVLPGPGTVVGEDWGGSVVNDVQLEALKTELPSAVHALEAKEASPSRLSISVPESEDGMWIFLADTFALFPGWEAILRRGNGQPGSPELVRSNHVTTALWLPPGEAGTLDLTYRTPRLGVGILLFVVSIAIIAAYLSRSRWKELLTPETVVT